jgi:signal transduction histidine kinase
MCTSINRLDDFIREILDYARNARTELEIEKIDFSQLLRLAQDKISLLAGANSLHVNVHIEGGEYFYSDYSRLGILFNNLLTNAVLYQDGNKETSFVDFSISVSTDKAVIKVRDNGVGIEKKFIDKIFNMFYKASAISTGSGLGLYIAKEIITRLGGVVTVTSEHSMFTEFEIVLPNTRPE